MKILICSDSHGDTTELERLKELHGDIDYFIHCGDSELDQHHPANSGYQVVAGNCDFGDDFPDQLMVKAGEERVLVTHGHLYGVKSNIMRLKFKALEEEATIVCFGHSHKLGIEMIDQILFINPGSISLPLSPKRKTYVILEIKETEKIASVYEYGKGVIFTEHFPQLET